MYTKYRLTILEIRLVFKILFVNFLLFGLNQPIAAQPRFDYIEDILPGGNDKTIEPWPSSLTYFESDYNYIMQWRDFFILPTPNLVVIESIPDSLPYENWGTPMHFVDEDGGGEPFDVINEKDIIKRYQIRKQKLGSWKSFIDQVHRKWSKKYRNFFLDYFDSTITSHIIGNIKYYYYDISFKNYVRYKERDHYDKLKNWLFQRETTYINSIQNNLDSLLFSKKYNLTDSKQIPESFISFVNIVLEQEKKSLIVGSDSSYYKAVKNITISSEPIEKTTLWFSNSIKERKIFISPILLRALFTISFNKYNNTYGDDYFKYDERFVNYDFFFKSKLPNGENNYVNREQNSLENVKLFNKVFYLKFVQGLSFILHHELAHIYLAQKGIPEISELRCDCYSLNFSNQITDISIGKPLGIFNNLLEASIKANRPDLWDVDNIEPLKARFGMIDSISTAQVSLKQCDSLFRMK